jgi:hypothetical protein
MRSPCSEDSYGPWLVAERVLIFVFVTVCATNCGAVDRGDCSFAGHHEAENDSNPWYCMRNCAGYSWSPTSRRTAAPAPWHAHAGAAAELLLAESHTLTPCPSGQQDNNSDPTTPRRYCSWFAIASLVSGTSTGRAYGRRAGRVWPVAATSHAGVFWRWQATGTYP